MFERGPAMRIRHALKKGASRDEILRFSISRRSRGWRALSWVRRPCLRPLVSVIRADRNGFGRPCRSCDQACFARSGKDLGARRHCLPQAACLTFRVHHGSDPFRQMVATTQFELTSQETPDDPQPPLIAACRRRTCHSRRAACLRTGQVSVQAPELRNLMNLWQAAFARATNRNLVLVIQIPQLHREACITGMP